MDKSDKKMCGHLQPQTSLSILQAPFEQRISTELMEFLKPLVLVVEREELAKNGNGAR